MEGPYNAALQKSPVAVNRARVNVTAHPFLRAVVDYLMVVVLDAPWHVPSGPAVVVERSARRPLAAQASLPDRRARSREALRLGAQETHVLGLGGMWTELLDDVAVVPLPADAARIEAALHSLRGAPVLFGGRGGTPVDVGAAARLAARLGELLLDGGYELIECNPVVVRPAGEGAVALDAVIRRGVSCTT